MPARLPAADRRGFLRGLTELDAIAERGEVPGPTSVAPAGEAASEGAGEAGHIA